ncbi:IS1380 family transposase [Ferruginivarius sediminum]|uniref:IS1380 family transposase n=1 Tax=Ferruginivarius sediminum TaxID=2661937 RepID=A0A369T8V9_9PROT|nr:IS1380 family transposase [Ferruginivarius sediminum]RDD61708.1 IS1380 family transposase [Ferruginivarius sediminum]
MQFDRSVKLAFQGSSISSDGGLLLHRELDDALNLTDIAAELIADPRTGRNGRHRLAGLLRQSLFSRLAGYEDVNDADRLCRDPVMRQLVGGRAVKDRAGSASAMGRFETQMLTRPENLAALTELPGRWIDAVHDRRPPKSITLDMDSSESPVHGDQEGSAWNGHFQSKCLHPLFVFNQFGDLERCALRPGNVHSADGWEDELRPVLARYSAEVRPSITRRRFRADAAFAIPTLFDLLEAEGWDYAIRIKGNRKLHDQIAWLTRRRPGRPPNHVVRHYTSFHYRAKNWSRPRRVVAKVEFHPGELFPRVGFIVTNRSLPNERVLAFYNDRGTAEQHIKEGKHAIRWTRLSCTRFAANAVRLHLHALAYNLANFLRTLATPEAIETWSLTSLRERLIKTGARLVRHARYAAFQFAEAALPRQVFVGILALINGLRAPPAATVFV